MLTRLTLLLLSATVASGCGTPGPTGAEDSCIPYCSLEFVDVRGVVLTQAGEPVPGVQVTGTGKGGWRRVALRPSARSTDSVAPTSEAR